MKHILVFGAGHADTALIEYLVQAAQANHWQLTVADANLSLALSKTRNAPNTNALALHLEDELGRRVLIATADIVISLLPPTLHYPIALECLHLNKHLLTASVIDDQVAALAPQIESKGLLFLCETGIDHMSAMQLVHRIKAGAGNIRSFISRRGQLTTPEKDDNPWHSTISGDVVHTGKRGATFKEHGDLKQIPYEQVFDPNRVIDIPGLGYMAWYPHHDSLKYIRLYELNEAHTFIRSTLRYPEFCFGWKNIVELKLTDDTPQYDTDGMTLQTFFQVHFARHGFSEWIEKQLTARFTQTKQLLEKLQQLLEAEQEAGEEERKALQDFMMVDNQGQLMDINLDLVKTQAAATVAGQMHEANLSMKQLLYLGMDDDNTVINKGRCSAADVMEFVLEKKLTGEPNRIVIQHDIEYEQEGALKKLISTCIAREVGLSIGIVAKLVLQNKITLTGLRIPVNVQIYQPVMDELARHGIHFNEIITTQ